MSLQLQLDNVLSTLLTKEFARKMKIDALISCIDLTLLDEHASADSVIKIRDQALNNNVAALCLYTENYEQLGHFKSDIPLATVINFPHANNTLDKCMQEINAARKLGVHEIDYVFPYPRYLKGDMESTISQTASIIKTCREYHLKTKIILETGAFPNCESIYQVCAELIPLGCDFLKTSTGKIPAGASLSAVFSMLSAIKDSGLPCGIKISGGVKTAEQAFAYAELAEILLNKNINPHWFRIGASSLLDNLLSFKKPQ